MKRKEDEPQKKALEEKNVDSRKRKISVSKAKASKKSRSVELGNAEDEIHESGIEQFCSVLQF